MADDNSTPVTPGDDKALSRREFAALSAAAGLAVAGGAHAAVPVTEAEVTVTTPDGACDAFVARPQGAGAWPVVIMWPDALGLRPAFRDMGRRMAAEGYAVIVPNQFYRSGKAPAAGLAIDFAKPEDRAKLTELRTPLTPAAVARDGTALLAYMDGQKFVNAKAKAGSVGYCMGGAMTMQTAAARPSRIGAGCSFHGGGLVTAGPDSPHLLVPKIKAAYHFGVAADDDEREPQAKVALAEAFTAAGLPATVEVYEGARHGWCVKGSAVYNEPQAERAWATMLALYKTTLV